MNKPDIIKVDPYPELSSVVMGVDPFPDNPTELKDYLKDVLNEINNLSQKDKAHYDILSYCKWRYYQSILDLYDDYGIEKFKSLTTFNFNYEKCFANGNLDSTKPSNKAGRRVDVRKDREKISSLRISFSTGPPQEKPPQRPVKSEYIAATFFALHCLNSTDVDDLCKPDSRTQISNLTCQLRENTKLKTAFEVDKINIRKKLNGNYKSENIDEINKRTKTYEKLCKQNHTIKQYEKHCFNMETEFIKSKLGTKLFGVKSSNRSEALFFNSQEEWKRGFTFSQFDHDLQKPQNDPKFKDRGKYQSQLRDKLKRTLSDAEDFEVSAAWFENRKLRKSDFSSLNY